MNLEEFNVIVFVTGAALGFVVALILKSITAKAAYKQNTSTSTAVTIKSLQAELDKKQVIIDNFFSDSNEHLSAAEKRLAEFRNTLSNGASQLSMVEISSKPATATNPTPEDEFDVVEPPKDYALKTQSEQGMLSEKFGLNDHSTNLEPKRTI